MIDRILRAAALAGALAFGFGAVWTTSATWATAQSDQGGDERVVVESEDPEMNAAIARARETIPQIADLLERHPQAIFQVKVKIESVRGTFWPWMSVERVRDGQFHGVLTNSDPTGGAYSAGDAWSTPFAEIGDWLIIVDNRGTGPIYGGFTIRVLAERAPGSVPQNLLNRLQPLP